MIFLTKKYYFRNYHSNIYQVLKIARLYSPADTMRYEHFTISLLLVFMFERVDWSLIEHFLISESLKNTTFWGKRLKNTGFLGTLKNLRIGPSIDCRRLRLVKSLFKNPDIFIRRPGKSWEFKKNQKSKIVCSVCFLSDRTKKTENGTFLKIVGEINVLARPRQCDFPFPQKTKTII